jgi:hypothetical protein
MKLCKLEALFFNGSLMWKHCATNVGHGSLIKSIVQEV